MEEKRPAQALPLETVRDRLRVQLQVEAKRAYVKKLIESMEIKLQE